MTARVSTGAGAETGDGRLRKGRRRRAALLAATMRVIERAGAAAVTHRAVGAEAGMAATSVVYYFPTVDDLLVAALVACNDGYLARLDDLSGAPHPLDRLAELVAGSGAGGRASAAAEYELFLMAARRPELRAEADRWARGLDAVLAGVVADPLARAGVAAAVDGLLLRALTATEPAGVDEIRAILQRLVASA